MVLAPLLVLALAPSPQDAAPRFADAASKETWIEADGVAAVTRATAWLARAQGESGGWAVGGGDDNPSLPASGMALLALLADGNTTRRGPHAKSVASAARWLVATAADGAASRPKGIALYALSELARLEPGAVQTDDLKRIADDLASEVMAEGGWPAYDGPQVDAMATVWAVAGLAEARRAGVAVDETTLRRTARWFDGQVSETGSVSLVTNSGAEEHGAAVLLLPRLLLGQKLDEARYLMRQAKRLTRRKAEPDWQQEDFEFWYASVTGLQLAAQPTRYADPRSADAREQLAEFADAAATYHARVRGLLLERQLSGGEADGSWAAYGWAPEQGPVRSTAMAVLMLTAPYRVRETAPAPAPEEVTVPKAFASRARARKRLAREGGKGTEEALALAIAWLVDNQNPNGSWQRDDTTHPVGTSALALLALLGDGHTPREGAHAAKVAKGLAWLRAQQSDTTGRVGAGPLEPYIYDHAVATLVLAEACAFDPTPEARASLDAAVKFCLRAQNPYAAWRYQVPPNGENDTSISTWMGMALVAAQDAGLEVDAQRFEQLNAWYGESTDAANGRTGYRENGGYSARVQGTAETFPVEKTEALTAAALMGRLFTFSGDRPDEATLGTWERQAQLLLRCLPEWDEKGGSIDLYYWYHATYALFQLGGKPWDAWNDALKAALLDAQRKDGAAGGSWDPVSAWSFVGGRVYSTALCALMLEVYFRHPRRVDVR